MKCFAIMPFSETTHLVEDTSVKINSDEWTHIFTDWIKKAVESYSDEKITCKRSESVQGNFVKGIIRDIYNSELAIVDLTGQKPNVYYELGIRHSLKLGTIIITQDFNALPSDLKSYYCFSYKYTSKSHLYQQYYEKFEKDLHEQIKSVLNNVNEPDSPVSDFLNLKHYYEVQERDKQGKILLNLIDSLNKHKDSVFADIQKYIDRKPTYIENNSIFFTFIDFFYIDNSISQLFNLEFEFFPEELIDKLKQYYLDFRKEIYFVHQYWEGTRTNISENNINTLIGFLEHLKSNRNVFDNQLKTISKEIKNEIKK